MNLKNRFLSLSILLLFAGASLVPIVAADEGDDATAREECEEEYAEAQAEAEGDVRIGSGSDDDEDRQEAQAKAEAEYQECLDEAQADEEDGSGGASIALSSSYSGRHVSFDVTHNGIRNYSVGEADIFSAASIEGDAGWDEFERDGASLDLEGDHARIKISDTPTGVLRFETEDDSAYIHLTFAEGVTAQSAPAGDHSGHGTDRFLLKGNGFQAVLFTEAGYRLTDSSLESPGEIRFVVVDAPGLDLRHSERTLDAIVDGRIAVEIDVESGQEFRGAEHAEVAVDIQPTPTGLIATVESHGEGKTVLFNLEHGALGNVEELEVIFDGQAIMHADDVEDVLDVSDGVAEYIILVGATSTQVMVQVPHFSVHTIELSGSAVGGGSTIVSTVAMVLGGAVAAVFVVATLAGRRRRH